MNAHFNELDIDIDRTIMRFLKIKKDDKNDQLYNLRKQQRRNGLGTPSYFEGFG